nr:hypothetical protein Itr_chr03CG05390 [Ipomoea trifida]
MQWCWFRFDKGRMPGRRSSTIHPHSKGDHKPRGSTKQKVSALRNFLGINSSLFSNNVFELNTNSGNADIYSNKNSVRVKTGAIPFPCYAFFLNNQRSIFDSPIHSRANMLTAVQLASPGFSLRKFPLNISLPEERIYSLAAYSRTADRYGHVPETLDERAASAPFASSRKWNILILREEWTSQHDPDPPDHSKTLISHDIDPMDLVASLNHGFLRRGDGLGAQGSHVTAFGWLLKGWGVKVPVEAELDEETVWAAGGKGSSSAKGSQGCTIIKQHEKESLIRQSPREKPLKEVPLFSVFAREVTKDSRSKVRNSADRPNPSSSGKRDRILAAASTGLLLRRDLSNENSCPPRSSSFAKSFFVHNSYQSATADSIASLPTPATQASFPSQGQFCLKLDPLASFRVGHGLSESASSPLPSAPSFGLVAIAVPDEGIAKKGSSFISLISSLTGLGQWDSQYGGQLCLNSYFRAQRLYAGRM